MTTHPPISSLIPHTGPSCLLEAVVHADGARTECRARIARNHPYLQGGRVHSLLAIELFAQGAAAHRALESAESKDAPRTAAPARGRLAAANVRLHRPELEPPMTLLVRVTPGATLGQLHSFTGQLYLDDDVTTADGTLQTNGAAADGTLQTNGAAADGTLQTNGGGASVGTRRRAGILLAEGDISVAVEETT